MNENSLQRRNQNYEFGDDECSTDSGCSSGGSTGSAEPLPQQSRCDNDRLNKAHYQELHRKRSLISSNLNINERVRIRCAKSWSPDNRRSQLDEESSLHSRNSSDFQTSDSRFSSLLKVFQALKISTQIDLNEKKFTKKIPKRILRPPVTYIYVRGLSGLPTQRVPRKSWFHHWCSRLVNSIDERTLIQRRSHLPDIQ